MLVLTLSHGVFTHFNSFDFHNHLVITLSFQARKLRYRKAKRHAQIYSAGPDLNPGTWSPCS